MLLLKLVVLYCLLLGVAAWFGYRSRFVWPDQDPAGPPPPDESPASEEYPPLPPPGKS